MSSYFITGSSRGIGSGLVKALASRPTSQVATVFASARKLSDDIKQLEASNPGRVYFIQLDVTDKESVKNAATKVEEILHGKGLDVLINNAGVSGFTNGTVDNTTDLEDVFRANVLGVHLVTSAFIPLLKKGIQKKVINISTTLGSFAFLKKYQGQPVPSYKISKAALNMLTVQYAQDFEKDGFTIFSLCPGWVKTELGTEYAELTIEQSIGGILEVLDNADASLNGKFLNVRIEGWENIQGTFHQYPGGEIPW